MLQISTPAAGLRLLQLDHPPVNGLALPLRQALHAALDAADADPQVRAVLLCGAGSGFSGGADIREFGQPEMLAQPNLHELCARLDAMRKPVVAALHGMALGGGLELALCCHGRVAAQGTQIGLPEVQIGLLPGAGGTQRLPRAVGLAVALEMISSGQPRSAQQLAELPGQRLIDRLCAPDELLAQAQSLALALADANRLERVRDRQLDEPEGEALLQAARSRAARLPYPAPAACVEAVAGSLRLPFDAGLAAERAGFERLLHSPESAALRHAFFAERAAARVPGIEPETERRKVDWVGVLGAGTMGSGIATACLMAGLQVALVEAAPEALARGVAAIEAHLAGQVRKGRISAAVAEQTRARLSTHADDSVLAAVDLVIEAVFEDLALKQRIFRRLDALARPGAILASNTSTLDLDAIAAVTRRPADVLGLHFFSPAAVMKLLEVVRGKATSAETLATGLALAKRLGKISVVSGVCDGFIGNRMLDKYLDQALALLDEGCSPEQVDGALEAWGMAMGPFRMGDLAGNDIGWRVRQQRVLQGKPQTPQPLADRLCELGRFGQKTGGGWYDYEGREAKPSPQVAELLAAHRPARQVEDAVIVQRLIGALASEGQQILDEGIALRPGDIDVVYLHGYGFPRWRGGPMFWASTSRAMGQT